MDQSDRGVPSRAARTHHALLIILGLAAISGCHDAETTAGKGATASEAANTASEAASAAPAAPPASGKRDELCDTPPTYETLKVPLTRRIEEKGVVLGVLRIAKDNSAKFTADPGAPAASIKRLAQVIEELAKGEGTLNLDWGGRTPAGVEYSCGGEVKRSDPRYPALFLVRVSSRYDRSLKFVELPDEGH
ncbi:MAG: hypothetical protein H6718_33115 [Polyangiaceae bacterium]|nr:hypothetical protein [Polyangiaceae bacterium]MCB9605047.1 hypothetical protein [Polyangiaceae bacterium]